MSGFFFITLCIVTLALLYLIEPQPATVVCISLETCSIAGLPSVAVGWVKIKVWSIPHLKGLTANFKLM